MSRYQGHLNLPGVGREGQEKLSRSSVLCIGTGGLGSPAALYLAAAGVGRIGLVDSDDVDESNLHRQILFRTPDVGASKVATAQAQLAALNPDVELVPHAERLTSRNARRILADYDVILDGTDNFPTRYVINDACVALGKPEVWASIFRFEGQLAVFDARRGPCYRCLFADVPPADEIPACSEAGVLGVLPGVLGTAQALEALKLLVGIGQPLIGRLQLFDALSFSWSDLSIEKDPACRTCGAGAAYTATVKAVEPDELQEQLQRSDAPQIVDCREAFEWEICRLPDSRLIPLRELGDRLHELDRDRPVVVVCYRGPRSQHAASTLAEAGFADVAFLEGGLHAWAREVDPTMARY